MIQFISILQTCTRVNHGLRISDDEHAFAVESVLGRSSVTHGFNMVEQQT